MTVKHPPTEIDGSEEPITCKFCDRPFRTDRHRNLHIAEWHEDEATSIDEESIQSAKEAEADDLYFYHLKVVFALGAIYSISVILYMVALGSDIF